MHQHSILTYLNFIKKQFFKVSKCFNFFFNLCCLKSFHQTIINYHNYNTVLFKLIHYTNKKAKNISCSRYISVLLHALKLT